FRQRRQDRAIIRDHAAGLLQEVVHTDLENDSARLGEGAVSTDPTEEPSSGVATDAEIENAGAHHRGVKALEDAVAEQNDRAIRRYRVFRQLPREEGLIGAFDLH